MATAIKIILVAVAAYFLGNFTTGLFVGKKMGHLDIRKQGSGNIGSTNVLRTLGWAPGVVTLVGDILKGALAALLGWWVLGRNGAYLGAAFAVLGHVYPVVLHFKGGKAVATAFGGILVTQPLIALILLLFQVVVIALTRYMSLASICSGVLYMLLMLLIFRDGAAGIAYSIFVAVMLLYAHRENIKRLLAHTENKLDFSKINKLGSERKGK